MDNPSSSMTMAQDTAFDKGHGIKDGSPLDKQLDKKTMGKSSNWMKSAVIPSHKGIFTAKAKRAGMSVPKFAAKEKNSKNITLGRQARLAQTFEKLAGKKS